MHIHFFLKGDTKWTSVCFSINLSENSEWKEKQTIITFIQLTVSHAFCHFWWVDYDIILKHV